MRIDLGWIHKVQGKVLAIQPDEAPAHSFNVPDEVETRGMFVFMYEQYYLILGVFVFAAVVP